jgi:hypothetical protein
MTTPNNNSLNTIATNLYGDTQIIDFNFPTINTDEIFKKQDGDNITGTKIYSTGTNTTNKITMTSDTSGLINVGTIEGERDIISNTSKLHINATGTQTDGITITSQGRVGIGVTDPEEDLEVDGSIQIDSAKVARLKFQKSGQSPHALGEIDGEEDGNNGGDLQFYTKEDGGNVTEKLRINNQGALGLGGTNYGTAGQVIVSNGSAALPSWEGPYLLSGSGTGNQNIPLNTITALNWATITTEGSASASDLPAGTSVWTASSSGLYHIVGHSFHTGTVYDQISNHHLYLEFRINSGATFSTIAADEFALGAPGDQASAVSCNISKYVSIDTGNQLRLTVFCRVASGSSYVNYDIGRTIFQIFKVK